jgi:hypothetical protein
MATSFPQNLDLQEFHSPATGLGVGRHPHINVRDAFAGGFPHAASRVVHFPNPDARDVKFGSIRKELGIGGDAVVNFGVVADGRLAFRKTGPLLATDVAKTVRRHFHPYYSGATRRYRTR